MIIRRVEELRIIPNITLNVLRTPFGNNNDRYNIFKRFVAIRKILIFLKKTYSSALWNIALV